MLLTLAVALAHPDHGGPRGQALDAAVFQDRFPPVPATYTGIVDDLRTRLAALQAAARDWKVADIVHECDTMVRFGRALPVKVTDQPEAMRNEVDTARAAFLHQIGVLRTGIPTHDEAVIREALAGIQAALDALPTPQPSSP